MTGKGIRRLGLAVTLTVGAVLGAYLGGTTVEACSVGAGFGRVGSCDTDVRLSPSGAIIGILVAALAVLLRDRRTRR